MKVRHLNCATLCPLAPDALSGGDFVCHCLLVETDDSGLVLVDTGLGTRDVTEPDQLPWMFRAFLRPELRRDETALEQVRELDRDPEDVQHIVPTHLDLDHAGGLPDFPDADVHVHAPEKEDALANPSPGLLRRDRRLERHWAHDPNWHTYEPAGETWFGFEAVRSLDGLPPEILLVPLPGHTIGHAGVAIETDDGWLLHAGDAYFSSAEISDGTPPPMVRAFQTMLDADRAARLHNQQRLRELRTNDEVTIVCAHDADELEAYAETRATV